jgi:hypothetical protein
MCVACIEYMKDKLTVEEFKSALHETTTEDQRHFKEMEELIRIYGSDRKELKKRMEELPTASWKN